MFNLFKKKEAKNLKDEFNSLISKIVESKFKNEGFKKQGRHFSRKINNITQSFDVQSSQFNSKEYISFTFNIGFFNDKIFTELGAKIIPDFPKTYNGFLYFRTGHLLYGGDKWFEINQKTDLCQLEKEINNVIDKVILMFNAHTTLISLKDFVHKYGWSEFASAVYFAVIGEKDEAEKKINNLYQEVLNPRPSVDMIKMPDGSTQEKLRKMDPSIQENHLRNFKDFADKYNLKIQ